MKLRTLWCGVALLGAGACGDDDTTMPPIDMGPPSFDLAIDGGPPGEDGGPRDLGTDDGGEDDADVDMGGDPPDGGVDPADVPAPRPLAPASAMHVTSPNIEFRWSLTAPATGARLEVCRDRACADVLERLDVSGESTTTIVPPDPGATSRVFHFRLLGIADGVVGSNRSPIWSFVVRGAVGASANASWGPLANPGGDRFADVVVGAAGSNAVRIYRGRTPAGSAPSPDVRLGGSGSLGREVAALGDVNGDGFADLAVGTDTEILVFHGRDGGLGASVSAGDADATIARAAGVVFAAAGDVDGDGYADLVTGDPGSASLALHRGSATGLEVTGAAVSGSFPAGTGTALAGACDVNADGFSDVIVGATDAARVLYGSTTGFDSVDILTAGPQSAGFGAAVACAGDINGDGYPDAAVGAPTGHAVFVYHGGSSGLGATPAGVLRKQPGDPGGGVTTRHGEDFGAVIAAAGDVNGDEIGDLLVVAPEAQTLVDNGFVGYAYVFHGSAGGFTSTAPDGNTTHNRAIGSSVGFEANRPTTAAGVGDIDGDGYDDIAVGAPLRNGGSGAVYVHLGAADGIPFGAAWSIEDGGLTGLGTSIARF